MPQSTSQQQSATPLLRGAPKHQENEKRRKETGEADEKIPYPKGAFFIIVNQFCERFNYNGMKAILPLFMRNTLRFDENLATVIYHSMTIVCYIFPILGAIVGDAYLGNFKTVLYFSLFYTVGSILLPIAAIPYLLPQAVVISMTALFFINVGCGGIRPCITAFGGDQFIVPQQLEAVETFFSAIYLAINAASLLAVFVTPILREDVECFGEDSCFALGFGVPAVVMILALAVFAIGKPFYAMKKPDRSVLSDFFACIWHGIKRRCTAKYESHDHWLDYACDKYDSQLIEDIKRVLSVTVVFIPLPVFWALYDQQGSRWTFQATRMNGDLGGWVVKPEQMQILNPVIVMLLIPVFDHIIYPVFKKCGLLTPLQRIGSGLVLCGVSFIVSAFLEINLEPTYARIPGEGYMQLNFINTLPCDMAIRYEIGAHQADLRVNSTGFVVVENLPANETIWIREAIAKGENCTLVANELRNVKLGSGSEKSSYSVLMTQRHNEIEIFRMNKEEQIEKSVSGDPLVGFYNMRSENTSIEGNIMLKQGRKEVMFYYNETSGATPASIDFVVQTDFQEVEIRDHEIYLSKNNESIGKVENLIQGGVYRIIILPNAEDASTYALMTVELTSPNTVSIMWLLPQILVVSIAEILFAVTLITFSYTEAPERMKSVMQAISLLIIAVGNFIVIIVAEAQSGLSQKNEFFLFAGIIGLATILFTFIGMRYKYVNNESK